MKRLLIQLMFLTSSCPLLANTMLKNPVTGPLNGTRLMKLSIASDGKDVVLLATDNTAIYAIDIADNAANEASSNVITSIPNFVSGKLTPLAGQPVNVVDMVVNPISKAVYVLAINTAYTTSFIFKVKNNGAFTTLLDLSNIKHSKLTWTGTAYIMDLAWGNSTLYASSGGGMASLDGELGWVKPPFQHNTAVSKRATTMFKSNWGSTYLTDAPLETIAYGDIAGKARLMGVTTCAPGFSLDVSSLSTGGVLQVTEDFNVNSGMSYKVVFQRHDGKNWLFDLHENFGGSDLYRIGEKYLDGSQVASGKHNANAVELRDINMNRSPGLTDADLKMYPGKYNAIAFWDDYRLLVLEANNGALKMMQTATNAPALNIENSASLSHTLDIYPNPSVGTVTVKLPEGMWKSTVTVYDLTGKIIWNRQVESANGVMEIQELSRGNYTLTVNGLNDIKATGKFVVQ